MELKNKLRKLSEVGIVLTVIVTLILTGCGGGAASSTLVSVLEGVAAVGTPIVSGNISVICAAGSALTTTNSSGAYTVTLSGQTLPCAVQVSGGMISGVTNTTSYNSIATSIGTVNVTPLTDLVVANLAGTATPSTWFSALTPTQLAAITPTKVTTALANVAATLPELPLVTTTNNPITTTFTPSSGNAIDDSLTALAQAVANTSGVTYTSLLSNVSTATISAPNAPAGLGSALTAAYTGTTSGGSTIGGTVTGLAGTMVLQDNGGNNLAASAIGAFTFASQVAKGTAYNVTVLTKPVSQTCTVTGGTGTATANVTSVAVTCTNINPPSNFSLAGVTANGVTLGGNLIAPVTIGIHTYYFWDASVNGVLHDALDQIFNGGALGDSTKDTTDTTGNIATLSNGLTIHLPTQAELLAIYAAQGIPTGWGSISMIYPYFAAATQVSPGVHDGVNFVSGLVSSGSDNVAHSSVTFEVVGGP